MSRSIPVRVVAALVAALATAACDGGPTQPGAPADELGRGLPQAAQSAAAADVFLTNTDLEATTAWFFSAPAGTSARYASGIGVDNSRGAELTGNGTAADEQFAFMGQSVQVGDLSGRKLTLTAKVRLIGVEGQGVSIALRGDNPARSGSPAQLFATTQGRIDISGTADWTTYTVELDGFTPEIRTIVAFVVFLPGTTGTVYVDDVTLSTEAAPLPQLALTNGDFETGNGTPDNWWWGGTGLRNFTFAWGATTAFAGTRAVSISRTSASAQDFAFWAQTLRPDAFLGGPVTLRVRVRPELAGPGVSLVIRGDDTPRPLGTANAFATTQGVRTITGSSGWVEQTVTLANLPSGMQSLTVYLVYLPGTTGTVHFDAVQLTR